MQIVGGRLSSHYQPGSNILACVPKPYSKVTIMFLLDCGRKKYWEIGQGNFKHNHLQSDRAETKCRISSSAKTGKHCRDKVDKMKDKYKVKTLKNDEIGALALNWPWFQRIHDITPSTAKIDGLLGAVDMGIDSFKGPLLLF